MAVRGTRRGKVGLLALVAVAGLATAVAWLSWTLGGQGGVASPSADRGSVVSTGGVPGQPSAAPSLGRGGEGFAWSYDLPEDPELQRQVIMGFEIWTAGQGDALRGVFMGTLDLGSEPVSLDRAAEKLRGELGMIPGATAATAPEPVRLPAGDALRVRLQVGTTPFVGYAVVVGGIGYRLIVTGYPDAVVEAVAMSLRFD